MGGIAYPTSPIASVGISFYVPKIIPIVQNSSNERFSIVLKLRHDILDTNVTVEEADLLSFNL